MGIKTGIYIVANDKVYEEAIALITSISLHCGDIPICIIPYNDQLKRITEWIQRSPQFNIEWFDIELVNKFQQHIDYLFDYPTAPKHKDKRNRLRNLLAWFGKYDRFFYIDCDIIVYRNIIPLLQKLDTQDFIHYDKQYLNKIKWVYTPLILTRHLNFEEKTFNAGFWGSKKDLFTQEELIDRLRRCKEVCGFFDFPSGSLAQPVINYLIHTKTELIFNWNKESGFPETWAGNKFLLKNGIPYQGDQRVYYIHWAGKPIEPNKYYYESWIKYRKHAENNLKIMIGLTISVEPYELVCANLNKVISILGVSLGKILVLNNGFKDIELLKQQYQLEVIEIKNRNTPIFIRFQMMLEYFLTTDIGYFIKMDPDTCFLRWEIKSILGGQFLHYKPEHKDRVWQYMPQYWKKKNPNFIHHKYIHSIHGGCMFMSRLVVESILPYFYSHSEEWTDQYLRNGSIQETWETPSLIGEEQSFGWYCKQAHIVINQRRMVDENRVLFNMKITNVDFLNHKTLYVIHPIKNMETFSKIDLTYNVKM